MNEILPMHWRYLWLLSAGTFNIVHSDKLRVSLEIDWIFFRNLNFPAKQKPPLYKKTISDLLKLKKEKRPWKSKEQM